MTESKNQLFVDIYRHDAHKLTGQAHENAPDTLAGVPVNKPVPYGADADAATMSRPSGQPTQTVPAHGSNYRLSLVSGDSQYDRESSAWRNADRAVQELLTKDDPKILHQTWLRSAVAGAFNESVYYPYTSLKYHTLLVAALADAYRTGAAFADLWLVVDAPDRIIPHRTVYAGDRCTLRLDMDPGDKPCARLGTHPWRSWSATWTRLTAHPLNPDDDRHDRLLDANLRRLGAWSTALQYLEDYQRELAP